MAATAGGGDAWRITGEDRIKHDSQFFTLKPVNGYISGDQARGFFMQSGLPTPVLGQIWGLADMNNDGKMDKKEFSIAMHLIKKKLQGYELPKALPATLKADPLARYRVNRDLWIDPATCNGAYGIPRSTPHIPHSLASHTPPVTSPCPPALLLGVAPAGMAGMGGAPRMSVITNGMPPMVAQAGFMGPVVGPAPVPGGFPAPSKQAVPPVSGNLAMPHPSKLKYTQLFNTHDRNKQGTLTGVEARAILMQTGAPQQTLAQVWGLSDVDKDGKLNCDEFCIAMHLIDLVKMGTLLPPKIPPELVPTKARSGSFGIPAPNVPPAAPVSDNFGDLLGSAGMPAPVQPTTNGEAKVEEVDTGPVTFEDRRKQNFDKGQAELDRRRLMLQEQMQQENRARLDKERKEQELRERQRQEQEMKRQQDLERQMERQRQVERQREEQRNKMLEQRESARRELERQRQMEWERQRKEQLMAEKAREYGQLTALKSQASNLNCELESLQGKKTEISTKISQVKNGVTDFTAHIEAMRSTRDLKLADIERLQKELQEMNQRLQSVQSKRQQLDLRVQTSVQANPMSETHRTMMHSVELKKTSVQKLKKDLEETEKVTEIKLTEIDKDNSQMTEMTSRIGRLQADIGQAERQRQDGQLRQSDEEERVRREKEKHDQLRKELEAQRFKEEAEKKSNEKSEKPESSGVNWFDFGGDTKTATTNDNWASVFDSQPPSAPKPKDMWASSQPTTANTDTADEKKTFKLSGPRQSYKALFQFDARNLDELTLLPGDTVMVYNDQTGAEPGWLGGEMGGKSGWFPEAYAEKSAEQDSSQILTANDASVAGAISSSSEDSSFITVPGKMPSLSPTPGQGKTAPEGLQAQALYPWKAKKENHLTFNKGDVIGVREQQDMWWSGELGGKVGWFPKSYVKLISGPSSNTPTPAAPTPTFNSALTTSILPAAPIANTTTERAPTEKPPAPTEKPPAPTEQAATATDGEPYVAVFPYISNEPGDLTFNQYDMITVTAMDGDWWTGTFGDKTGIFPATYVQKSDAQPAVDSLQPDVSVAPAFTTTNTTQPSFDFDMFSSLTTSPGVTGNPLTDSSQGINSASVFGKDPFSNDPFSSFGTDVQSSSTLSPNVADPLFGELGNLSQSSSPALGFSAALDSPSVTSSASPVRASLAAASAASDHSLTASPLPTVSVTKPPGPFDELAGLKADMSFGSSANVGDAFLSDPIKDTLSESKKYSDPILGELEKLSQSNSPALGLTSSFSPESTTSANVAFMDDPFKDESSKSNIFLGSSLGELDKLSHLSSPAGGLAHNLSSPNLTTSTSLGFLSPANTHGSGSVSRSLTTSPFPALPGPVQTSSSADKLPSATAFGDAFQTVLSANQNVPSPETSSSTGDPYAAFAGLSESSSSMTTDLPAKEPGKPPSVTVISDTFPTVSFASQNDPRSDTGGHAGLTGDPYAAFAGLSESTSTVTSPSPFPDPSSSWLESVEGDANTSLPADLTSISGNLTSQVNIPVDDSSQTVNIAATVRGMAAIPAPSTVLQADAHSLSQFDVSNAESTLPTKRTPTFQDFTDFDMLISKYGPTVASSSNDFPNLEGSFSQSDTDNNPPALPEKQKSPFGGKEGLNAGIFGGVGVTGGVVVAVSGVGDSSVSAGVDSSDRSNTSAQQGSLKSLKKQEIATVIAAYTASGQEQLSLNPGQLIQVRKKSASGWWEGELQARGQKRKIGWFPANYVKLLVGSARNTPDNSLNRGVSPSSLSMASNPSPAPQPQPTMAPAQPSLQPVSTTPQPSAPQPSAPQPSAPKYVDHVIALYPYMAQNADELTFQKDSVINVIKKTDADWWQGEINGNVGMFPSNYVSSTSPESTSWSTDPQVLAVTSQEEGKRQSRIQELITTEETYMADMSIVLDAFYKPLELNGCMSGEEMLAIFVNWKDLIICNTKFLKALRVRKKMCGVGQVVKCIGDILCESIPHMTAYIRFCSCQLNAAALLQRLTENNPQFTEIHKKCVQNPKTKGMPLSSFLLKPMQRITKYPLLVDKILNHTPTGHPDHPHLIEALECSQELCSQVNEGVREKENSDRLEWIQQHVHCDGLPEKIAFNTVTNCLGPRKLLHTGVVCKAKSNKELAAFLFNDFLLLTTSNKPLSMANHSVFDPTGQVQYKMYKIPVFLNEVMVKSPQEENSDVFTLSHIDRVYNLRCGSQHDRDTWAKKLLTSSRHYLDTERKKREKASNSPKSSRGVGRLLVIIEEGNNLVSSHDVRRSPGVGRLLVVLIEGIDLKASDVNGKSDPYCEVSMGAQEHKTKVINQTLNPKWNSSMQFTIRDANTDVLCITVFDRDLFTPNDFLGRTEIRVKDIMQDTGNQGRRPITRKLLLHEVSTGEVVVKLDLHIFDQT